MYDQLLRDALELIDRDGCENLTHGRCFDVPGRVRGAVFTADAWCAPCVARKALDDSLGLSSPHRPQRGDDVERWLHRQRDAWNRTGERLEFRAIDSLLDHYRECADYGLTLRTENDERAER